MEICDFGKGIPFWISNNGGTLSVEKSITKQGTGSLKWEFNTGDTLIINGDVGYKHTSNNGEDSRVSTFATYLYGFSDGEKLFVDFFEDDLKKTGFEIVLGFSGWRSIFVCFDRDMSGEATEGMDKTVFTAQGKGTLLISELILSNLMEERYVHKSYQVPYVENNFMKIHLKWDFKEEYKNVTIADDDIEKIKKRFLSYCLNEIVDKDQNFNQICQMVDEFGIAEGEYGVNGKKVEWIKQRLIVKGTPWEKEEYVTFLDVSKVLLKIASYYTYTNCEQARDLYLKVLRYMISQGFQEGSSLGTHNILGYAFRHLYTSVFLMEKELESAGMLESLVDTMLWFLGVYRYGFAQDIPTNLASCDDFNNIARGILAVILMISNKKQRASYLWCYRDWINESLLCRTGLQGMLKEDGTIFHHCGHYISYGNGALEGATAIMYSLFDTSLQLDEKAYNNLKKVLESVHFQACGRCLPLAFSGRHALRVPKIFTSSYKYFSLIALEKGDTYPAGLYKTLKETPDDEIDRILFEKATVADVAFNDNRSYPLACACVHKRNGYMAVAKGFSKYLWGSEIYINNNIYGRYRSYGGLELLNGKRAFSHDGYDWNRFPGTTTIHIPLEKLKANVLNVDKHSGFEEILLSKESFASSVSLNKNGMFSMILSEHPKYNGTHTAHKSIFFFNDFILLLGTNISNMSEYETETTLFQNSLEDNHIPRINDEVYIGEYTIKSGDILTDCYGNNYYIKEGTRIFVKSELQESRSSVDNSATTGVFETAVISHGVSPHNESYEYAIGVMGAKKEDYQLIRADEKAHIVKIGNIMYVSIFVPGIYDDIEVNEPVMLMIEETEKEYSIAVTNPDLGIYDSDISQYDLNGEQKEVSIYSRKWISNPIGSKMVSFNIKRLGIKFDVALIGGKICNLKIKK